MKKYSILLIALLLVAAGCEGLLGDPSKGEFKIPEFLAGLFGSEGMTKTEISKMSPDEVKAKSDQMLSKMIQEKATKIQAAKNEVPSADAPIVVNTISLEYQGKTYEGVIDNNDNLDYSSITFFGPSINKNTVTTIANMRIEGKVLVAGNSKGFAEANAEEIYEAKSVKFYPFEWQDSEYGGYGLGLVSIEIEGHTREYVANWILDTN